MGKIQLEDNKSSGKISNRKKKLTILIISGLPIWVQGERKTIPSLYEGVRAFIRNGHEVHFLTCFPPLYYDVNGSNINKDCAKEYINNYEFSIPVGNILKKLTNVTLSNILIQLFQYAVRLASGYILWILFTYGAVKKGRSIYKKYRPDIVYAYNEMAALSSYIIAKLCRVPNITRLFGTFLYDVLSSRGFWFRYMVAISGFKIPSTYLIVGDDGTRGDKVAEFLRIDKGRLKFWKNGIDFDIYDPNLDLEVARRELDINQQTKVVLSLCRLEKWKGVDRVIEAVPAVVSRNKDVQFIIAGDGAEKKSLEEKVEDLKVSEWVRFLGNVDREKVKKLMNLADIFVTLQDISNLSNVFLEAFVAGRCIVTFNDGSMDGLIIDGFSGFFVNKGSRRDLEECLLKLLGDDQLRKQVGNNARQMARQVLESWEERTDKEVALVEDLVSNWHSKIQ
jgi:glycosyltransferase involved in cell wall biosynthesis